MSPSPAGRRRPPVSALWVRAQQALARDATSDLAPGSALVLTPHADDETIACGLLVAHKAAAGVPVWVALATDGRGGWYSDEPEPDPDEIVGVRAAEWDRALDALGVAADARHRFDLPDGSLGARQNELADAIGRLLDAHRPDQVFVSAGDDLHVDHRALARAACRAVSASRAERGSDGAPALFAYRVYPAAGAWPDGHSGVSTPLATAGRIVRSSPRLLTDRSLAFHGPDAVGAKHRAVAAFTSQKRLIDGELRYVWGTDVELFRPIDPTTGRRRGNTG